MGHTLTLKQFQNHSYQEKMLAQPPALYAGQVRQLNWIIGLSGETGELAELIKHDIFYGQPVDKMKVAKEIGDVLWYLGALADSYDIQLQDVLELNKAKIDHRYDGEYNQEGSAERHTREEAFEDTDEYRRLCQRIGGK